MRRRRTKRNPAQPSSASRRRGATVATTTNVPATTRRNARAPSRQASTTPQPVSAGCDDAALAQLERDRRVRGLVVEVADPPARLLELELGLRELTLDGQRGRDRVGPVEELEQLTLDRLEVPGARLEVDVLGRDVLAPLVLRFDPAQPGHGRHRLGVPPGRDADRQRPAQGLVRPGPGGLRGDDEPAQPRGDAPRLGHRLLVLALRHAQAERGGLDHLGRDPGHLLRRGHGLPVAARGAFLGLGVVGRGRLGCRRAAAVVVRPGAGRRH